MKKILDPKWELFIKVAEIGTVSGAALAMDMQQSVVSRHIAQLEQESGTRLFRRTGRGVVLTEFGQQVYPRVRTLIRDADQLADDMRTSSGTPIGDVRVGLLPSTVQVLAGPLFSSVRKSWPQVRLHLSEGPSAQLQEWLGQGRLDLALLLREEDDSPAPKDTLLSRSSLYLIVPARHALATRKSIAFEEVATLPLVLPNDLHPLRIRLTKLAKQKGLALTHVLEADSIRLQHELVACDGGFAITAGTLTPQEERKLAAVRIVRPVLSRSVVLGVTEHRAHTRATLAVMRLLQSLGQAMLKSTPKD